MSEFEALPCQHSWVRDDTGPRSFLLCTLCGLEDSVKRLGDPPQDDSLVQANATIADLREQCADLTRAVNQNYQLLQDARDSNACLLEQVSRLQERLANAIAPPPSPGTAPTPAKPAEPKPPSYRWGLLLT